MFGILIPSRDLATQMFSEISINLKKNRKANSCPLYHSPVRQLDALHDLE